MSQLLSGAPTVAGVETSHGQIAFAVQNALSNLLGARQGTLQTTARSGDKIAELLQKAASAYDKGDERSAGKLKSTMEGASPAAGASAASGASGASGGSGASGATGAIGQVLGQLGQMGQQGSGAVQGLTQGLQQVPQQVMQGVQQIVEAATSAAEGSAAEGGAGEAESGAGPGIVPDGRPGADSERAPERVNPGIVPPATPTRTQQV